ncbi:MAG: fumarylacetoacetate hydrolase family protein [Pyrinomonadaceae bacterium]
MKLFRFGPVGREKPGAIFLESRRLDVSAFGQDYDEQFFAADGISRLERWLTQHADECPIVDEGVRLGPCIVRPSKIICIGLNYAGHAAEGGLEIPKEPVIFFKATSAVCGPNDDVIIPKGSQKTDWEVELAVIIGKRTSHVSKVEANSYIAGYALHNDYSEREFQLERGGQWVKGKSCDTFAPLGPFLVTRDEVPDPHNLRLWLKVNGKLLQDANTSDLIFDVPTLVSYLSKFMSLLPGDVISTGTPAGVGFGLKPPRFLSHGDVVELGIDGLGNSRQRALSYESLTSRTSSAT